MKFDKTKIILNAYGGGTIGLTGVTDIDDFGRSR